MIHKHGSEVICPITKSKSKRIKIKKLGFVLLKIYYSYAYLSDKMSSIEKRSRLIALIRLIMKALFSKT